MQIETLILTRPPCDNKIQSNNSRISLTKKMTIAPMKNVHLQYSDKNVKKDTTKEDRSIQREEQVSENSFTIYSHCLTLKKEREKER